MSTIREIYSVVKKMESHGIEGYHVDNKYYDPLKMKKEKQLESSKDKPSSRPPNVPKKTSFIDQVQKIKAKLPGPCSYQPKELTGKSKTESLVPPGQRKTIFDDISHYHKKNNFPQAGRYDKVKVEVDKSKLKSDLSKADKANYLDSSMRDSVDRPGAGSYNSYHGTEDRRAPKWQAQLNKEKPSKSMSVKLPPVGTYTPLPLEYNLFENELGSKKRYRSDLNKQQRFKKSREKPLPFYNILSEWGMKNKTQKKDILCRLSSPSTHRSVYY